MRIIRTNTPAAAAAAETALKHGQSWLKVAKKYSVDVATKSIGGLLTGVTQGQEETALNNAAFSAPANKLLGPIHGTFGYYVYEVVKINKGTHQSLVQATPLIRQLLTSQNRSSEQAAVDKAAGAKWKAKTHCRTAYYMVDCGGTPPPTPTTPTVPSVTPTTATPGASGATGAATASGSATPPVSTVPSTTVTVPATTTPTASGTGTSKTKK
jgi:hypothetical protein